MKTLILILAVTTTIGCNDGGGSAAPTAVKAPSVDPIVSVTTTTVPQAPTTTMATTTTTTTTVPAQIVSVTYHSSVDRQDTVAPHCLVDSVGYCATYGSVTSGFDSTNAVYCWDEGLEKAFASPSGWPCSQYDDHWSYWLGFNSDDWMSTPTFMSTHVLQLVGDSSGTNVITILGKPGISVDCLLSGGVVTCPNFIIDTNQVPK